MMKLMQEISGIFRNLEALVNFCRISRDGSNARKHDLNPLDALQTVFLSNSAVPPVDNSRAATSRQTESNRL